MDWKLLPWLEENNLEQYYDIFKGEIGDDLDCLYYLTEKILENDFKITNAFHRFKIIHRINDLKKKRSHKGTFSSCSQ